MTDQDCFFRQDRRERNSCCRQQPERRQHRHSDGRLPSLSGKDTAHALYRRQREMYSVRIDP